ncbi:MAG TPA: hypothetical protein VNU92_15375 [Edaphobacter sp.]|jgi:hypothetical protein|nr:hypothetical protein [Edaphobacter sp.]
MSEQRPTSSDPTPEQRTGDSSIKPVVIGFIATILIILVAALIFIKTHQNKIVPKANDSTPTSQTVRPPLPALPQLAIAA